MTIFDFVDYKGFIKAWVLSQEKRGRGFYRNLSQHLGCNTTAVSLIFSGDRHLSIEQAYDTCQLLELSALEQEYFLTLVQSARAGKANLQKYYQTKIKELQAKALNLKKRLAPDAEMDEQAKAVFYSNWFYSAIRVALSIDKYSNLDDLAHALDLPRATVQEVVQFLLRHSLAVEKDGRVQIGPAYLHLDKDSPYVKSRQLSWRLKGFEYMDHRKPTDLFYTCPVSISERGLELVQKELTAMIERVLKLVKNEEAEKLVCLNIDWFRLD